MSVHAARDRDTDYEPRPWTDALLSRTHPLKDPAQSIDPNRRSSKPGGNIKGKVTRVYRDLIVVEFNDTIEGLQSGRWR